MASGPNTSWEIDGETVSDFVFGGSKITADGDWSHEIKRRLLQWSCMDVRVGLWRKLSTEELMLLNCGVGEDS